MHLVDFAAITGVGAQRVEVHAQRQESRARSGPAPNAASPDQQFARVLRVEDIWSVERTKVSSDGPVSHHRNEGVRVAVDPAITDLNTHIRVRTEPLSWGRWVDGVESAIAAVDCDPL